MNQESLSMDFDLRHAPERVWQALTDPELLARWLLPVTGFRLDSGAAFQFRADPQGDWDGAVRCRVLDVEAPRKISYTWVVGDFLDTVVTFTLTPTGTGTRLSLVQSGFRPDQRTAATGARYGWKLMTGRLLALLDEESP
jgi:uncharacterized protein YndB with AHSA1/START domain